MNKRILLVAYENDVLECFPVILKMAGHDVALVHRGLQGINHARATNPDLILLDTVLPDMDGLTAEGILKRLPSTAAIPVIVLKPRAHKLMPAFLQHERVHSGSVQSLDPRELLKQVDEAFAAVRLVQDEEELEETVAGRF